MLGIPTVLDRVQTILNSDSSDESDEIVSPSSTAFCVGLVHGAFGNLGHGLTKGFEVIGLGLVGEDIAVNEKGREDTPYPYRQKL
ncbi:MAG: hypothetical protein ACOC23_08830 [Thermodesulfobacteriota bacterium]